jgi:hypothetical protein
MAIAATQGRIGLGISLRREASVVASSRLIDAPLIAADRAAIADLRMRDMRKRVREQRTGRQEALVPFEVAVARQRAD